MNIKPYTGLVIGAAASVVALSPARSADLQVVDLNIQPQGTGLQVQLAIAASDDGKAPEVFTVSRNNTTITDIRNAQLDLGDRQKLIQQNPMPGIESIEIMQINPGNVRIIAMGKDSAPTGEILSSDQQNFIFNFTPQSSSDLSPSPVLVAQTNEVEEETNGNATPLTVDPAASPEPEILFPDPQIPREGKPSPTNSDNFLRPVAPLPPFLPRASAPPVGDISVSTIDTSFPNYVDLGTAAVVPRLVLKEAPVQDVLALLSRSANLNVVFAENTSSSGDGESAASSTSLADKTISLDLENEPIQEVFNYVLMLSDLKATMRGRTIFVGTALPNAITPKITRTFRLNQIKVAQARCYLETGNSVYEAVEFTGEFVEFEETECAGEVDDDENTSGGLR
ncbi:MAG: secretin and TonB N-terminal domain-containing protein, partial [Limnothrix sp.]